MRFNVREGVKMQVSFNPNVNFKQQSAHQFGVPFQSASAPNVVYVPVEQKKPSGFKENISGIAKFFTNAKEFIKATAKAVGYGAATAGTLLAGFWVFGALPRGFKAGNSLINTIKQPLKSISRQGKIISTVAALGVMTYHLVKGRLIANQRTANIDHQLRTGHRTT